MGINSMVWKGSSSGAADEQVGEFVEALDRAVLGGGWSRCDALGAVVVGTVDDLDGRVAEADHVRRALGRRDAFVGVQRHQCRVADAGVYGDRGDAGVGGEDGEREL